MRFAFVFVGIALMLIGAIVVVGAVLQVAPTTTSVKAWEHVVSGGVVYDGVFPVSQDFVPTRDTIHSGMSFRFFFSGSGARSITYSVACDGASRGGGSTTYQPSTSSGEKYLTVTATTINGVTAQGAACVLTVSVTGSGVHYWVRDSTSRIAVVWGEPYVAPVPPGPAPPPESQPPSGVGETGAGEEPLPPIEAAIDAVTGAAGAEAEGRFVIGAILVVLGVIFLLAATRVG